MKRILKLLGMICLCNSLVAQTPWLYENSFYRATDMVETYDNGVVIFANDESANGPCKLFKLDRAGNLLWTHTFEENSLTAVCSMEEDTQGNLVLAGRTFISGNYVDGFILKLSPCGDIIWYKELQIEDVYNFVVDLILDENDNILILHNIENINNQGEFEQTTLKKYTSTGDFVWASNLSPNNDSIPLKIIACSGGYMIESHCYKPPYFDQSSNLHYVRASVIKTDSLGEVQWSNFYRWDQDNLDTIFMSKAYPFGAILELKSNDFCTIVSKLDDPNYRQELYKIDENGEVFWSYDLSEDERTYQGGIMVQATDSNLIVGLTVGNGNNNFDDTFIELHKLTLDGQEIERWECQDETTELRAFKWNSDSTSIYALPEFVFTNVPNLYVFKFDPELMQLDTFDLSDDTEYDYLCPGGVQDLNFDFPDVVSVEEYKETPHTQLSIAPNPAGEFTYLYFDILNFNRSAKLEIYNLQGVLINSYPLLGSNGTVKEDLTSYSNGTYIVSIMLNGSVLESSKMTVQK